MTFKTCDFRGVFKEDFEGNVEGEVEGDFRGDFKQDLEGDLLSSSGQLLSRSGLVQVWFSIELKINSFELDSEVGRLVLCSDWSLTFSEGGSPSSTPLRMSLKLLRCSFRSYIENNKY